MENIVCIKHPQYSGENAPVLSCKTCCSKYIATIKATQAKLAASHANKTADSDSQLPKAMNKDR